MSGPPELGRSAWVLAALALGLAGVTGCRHRQAVYQPPPQALPPVEQPQRPQTSENYPYPPPPPARIPVTPAPPDGVDAADLEFVATHRPILTETGLATWYTAPYGRKAANGELFDNYAYTAANRTLPMGSLVVVTNLRTGQSSAMRITDRGPFVEGRIVDLTIASARATGVYREGLAQVRLDVYETPKPIWTGGRWCVQIGAFTSQRQAVDFKKQLMRRYPAANVIEFPGEKSYWVRIRPEGDNRAMAEWLANNLHPSEGEPYLTRLD
ncbi:MAG: septal ring lytic transglycosylase RlpA family protein [Terracidiphilus sp.]